MKTTKRITLQLLSVLVIVSFGFVAASAQNGKVLALVMKSDAAGISELISDGADVNEVDKLKFTPLMRASKIGDKPTIETLLKHNADPNMQNKVGATALMFAAKYGHPHVVDMLLEHGADPNIKTRDGYKASTFALGYKYFDLGEKLQDAERIFTKKTEKSYANN